MRRAIPSAGRPMVLPADIRFMNGMSVMFGVVFVLMALVILASWLFRQPIFNLSGITVRGDMTHNNAITLRANVAPRLVGNFFTINLAQTRAVFESAPWVRKAVVHRQFPNRLSVVLQEHQAVAYWGADDNTLLVNSFGEVFEANQAEVESADLPQLAGPPGQTPLVLQAYRRLVTQFEKLDMQLERLELTRQGSWRARLDSGAELELGHGSVDDIDGRTQRFIATLNQVSSRYGRDLESADLRYSNGYALKLKGVSTLSPGDKDYTQAKR